MLCLAVIGLLIGVWLLVVLCLARYFGAPDTFFGLAGLFWKWIAG